MTDTTRPRLVAEISNNHNGSLARACRLIDAAAAAGADYVKFQAYTPEELVALRGDGPAPEPWGSQGWSMADLYMKARTPLPWIRTLVGHATKTAGIGWFSSVFGEESYAAVNFMNPEFYKVACLDRMNPLLWDHLQMRVHPDALMVSVRSSEEFKGAGVTRLWCPEGYPQDEDELLGNMEPMMGVLDGLSYHGTDVEVLKRAADAGARWLEFHFQLSAEPSELESGVSINEDDLTELREHLDR